MMFLAAVLVGLLSLSLPTVASAPAGAEELPFDLALEQGILTVRDAEEPASLEIPTTITGTVDDANGVITGGNFSAASLEFQFQITEPVVADIFVDAVFTQLTPGAITGSVTKLPDGKASVAVDIDVKVDLHIEVGNPAFITNDCLATPVSLRLTSTVPYDSETDQVTLRDADFTVPPVPQTEQCVEVVADGVNSRLAGGGHFIEMVMEGTIPNIRIGVEDSVTTLAAEPESSRAGDEVTLTVNVVPGPEAPAGTPVGVVEFRDGGTVLGTSPLSGGTAVFTTTSLSVGNHALTAVYQGDEAYAPSPPSAVVNHLVAQAPTVTLPDTISPVTIGGNPRPFTVQVLNPTELGAPIVNGRLDITIARVLSTTSSFNTSRMTLEWLNGSTWEPITLTEVSPRNLRGSIGPSTGAALPPGPPTDVKLRLIAPLVAGTASPTACGVTNPTCPGPLTVTATLNEVDPLTGAVVEAHAEDQAPVNLIETSRRPTTMNFSGGGPRPHTVRQGFTLLVGAQLTPNFGNVPWGGFAEVYIDGIQTPLRNPNLPFEDGYANQFVVGGTSVTGLILLPTDIDTGPHSITVRYLGDAFHGPGEVTSSFTVLPSAGQFFICRETTLAIDAEWGANVVFEADLPASAKAGTPIEVPVTDARLLMHRPTFSGPLLFLNNDETVEVGTANLEGITFDVGPEGGGTAGAISRSGGSAISGPNPAPESSVDQTYTFTDLDVSATVSGDPGANVPVELNEFVINYRDSQLDFPLSARCFARDDKPLKVDEVEVAGTTVTATPDPAREITDEVDLEASTFPSDAAGTVSFESDLDGDLGDVTVEEGGATLSTDELSPGIHEITASFNATDPEVPDTEGTVTVKVQYSPRTGTEAFVVAARTDFTGNADEQDVIDDAELLAGGVKKSKYLTDLSKSDEYLTYVVQQMYLDMLGREGDADGVAFWVGRLRGGWSVVRVTAHFYASPEYFDRSGGTAGAWVEDLYGKLLGRSPDTGGRAYWAGEVDRVGRGSVARRFFQSGESARARVTALYERFLDRAPDQGGQDFWANRVVASGDLALAVSLTVSTEYAHRADTRFPLV